MQFPTLSLFTFTFITLFSDAWAIVYFTNTNYSNIAVNKPYTLNCVDDGTPANLSLYHGPANNMPFVRNISSNNPITAFVYTPKETSLVDYFLVRMTQSGSTFSSPRFFLLGLVARVPTTMAGSIIINMTVVPTDLVDPNSELPKIIMGMARPTEAAAIEDKMVARAAQPTSLTGAYATDAANGAPTAAAQLSAAAVASPSEYAAETVVATTNAAIAGYSNSTTPTMSAIPISMAILSSSGVTAVTVKSSGSSSSAHVASTSGTVIAGSPGHAPYSSTNATTLVSSMAPSISSSSCTGAVAQGTGVRVAAGGLTGLLALTTVIVLLLG